MILAASQSQPGSQPTGKLCPYIPPEQARLLALHHNLLEGAKNVSGLEVTPERTKETLWRTPEEIATYAVGEKAALDSRVIQLCNLFRSEGWVPRQQRPRGWT